MGSTKRLPLGPALPKPAAETISALRDKSLRRAAIASEFGTPAPPSFEATPRYLLERWYQNTPGGFEGAVESSRRAMDQYGVDQGYGRWPASNADQPVKIVLADARLDGPDVIMPNNVGEYRPAGRTIALDVSPNKTLQANRGVLDHELTHALMMNHWADSPASELLGTQTKDGPFFRPPSQQGFDMGMTDNWEPADVIRAMRATLPAAHIASDRIARRPELEYRMSRAEMDPHLAEIRRRYAYSTGRDVKTPDDAQQALDWWESWARKDWFGDVKDRPAHLQYIDRAIRLMGADDRLRRRMTQVPAVLGGLIGAGAASEQGQQ